MEELEALEEFAATPDAPGTGMGDVREKEQAGLEQYEEGFRIGSLPMDRPVDFLEFRALDEACMAGRGAYLACQGLQDGAKANPYTFDPQDFAPIPTKARPRLFKRVRRWMSAEEAKLWRGRTTMPQPREHGTYVVIDPSAPRPGAANKGAVPVDFDVPLDAIAPASKPEWGQIFNQGRAVPIQNVVIGDPTK